jgi:drug/metabolite transporter (DMT)-like permease
VLTKLAPALFVFLWSTGFIGVKYGIPYAPEKYGGVIPTLAGTSIQYAATTLVLLVLALLFEEPSINWSLKFFGALTWLVLALSFGAILLLFFLLSQGSAASVSSLYYLVPAVTAIIAYFLFDEEISTLSLIGTAITVVGVWLVVSNQKETLTAN